MTADEHRSPARIGRRAALILALTPLAAASASPRTDVVPAAAQPLPPPTPTPSTPRPSVAIRPVSHWAGIVQRGWDFQYADSLPLSRSADSWDHYSLSYSVDACVAMFRATRQTRYLDRALEYVENVAGTAVASKDLPTSRHRDRYRGWVSQRPGVEGEEVPLYESYFWRYGTAVLAAMRDTPAVYADASYRARYDRLLRFAEVDVFEKWHSRGPGEHIYRERTHMAAHWALIALHLSQLTGDPARRTRYLHVVDDIDLHLPGRGGGLRAQLRRHPTEPTAYFWSDVWGSAQRPGQDVSHGNGVMAYVVEAHDRGDIWTDADMAAFSALLTKVIWPGGRTYRSHVDGSGSDNGWFSDGFVKLGRYDPAVQHRLESHEVANEQFAANMALNAAILLS